MPSLENYGHDDCKDLHNVQLVSAAISQVSVTVSRNKVVKSWKEVQRLISLKTFKSFRRLSPWVVSMEGHTKSSRVQIRYILCDRNRMCFL